ncbi:restriction endonuclease subunit S [Paenibacillus oleatilyticus]|uniref:Restriction endonuclease subunit S n=1 Tax=Paenibacillus oleatilyticus TaxID=2594886 RepID=A0ABV4UZW9_9BACL
MEDMNALNRKTIGWSSVKLGQFVISEKGKKPKKLVKENNDNYSIPYVNIQAFEKNIIEEYTDGEGCVICDEDDFLMVWDGSRSGFVGRAIYGAVGSTLVKINFPGISNLYAYYFLKSKFIEINTRAKGTGTPHVDPNLLWNYNFPIAPLNEQKRIVDKIEELFSELDYGIETLKNIQQQLKVYRQTVLKWAYEGKLTEKWRKGQNDLETGNQLLEQIGNDFEKTKNTKVKNQNMTEEELNELPELPITWSSAKLNFLANIIGGVTKGRDFKNKHTIMIPYLRVANVQDGYLDLKEIKEIEIVETEKSKYLLKENDILYTEGGDKDKLGRGTIWKGQVKDCIHQNHVFRARLNSELISPKYIAYYSQTKLAKNYFYKNAKQTVNLASINMTVLSNLVIPIPSQLEQIKIVEEIESRFSICEKLEEAINLSLKQADQLRQSIFQKAFEGKLVPQDPNDEPVELLLERIRKMREEHYSSTGTKPKRSKK